MKFTVADRAEGKTTKALELLLGDSFLVLVCAGEHIAEHARRRFQDMGGVPGKYHLDKEVQQYLENRIISLSSLYRLRGKRLMKVVFDDADSILQDLAFSHEVVHVFASGEVEPLEQRST